MEFTELPKNWGDLDLTTGDLATGVIDLFLDIPSREAGCLLFLFLDDEGRLRVPVAIDDIPEDAEPGRIQEMLEHFTAGDFAGHSVLIARGRSGAPFSTPEDRRWANSLRQTLADSEGCQLRGFYLATPAHIRQLVLGAAGRMPASA